MLTFPGPIRKCRSEVSRRDVLRVGSLAFAGLTLPEILRLRAAGAAPSAGRGKSVIMIWMRGGPSHIDSYDMKPDAPAEIRGEFRPIETNVPGIQICEYLPLHARIMDKLAILRGIRSNDLGDHTPHYIVTGFPDRGVRPAFGSVVSYFRPWSGGLPPYVSMMYRSDGTHENATYTGPAHRPFVPSGDEVANLGLAEGVPLERLHDRRHLLRQLDGLSRAVDHRGSTVRWDAYTRQAVEMVTSPGVRTAFDVGREPPEVRARYGEFCEHFLLARRLVEAGVTVVTLKVGDWDTHEKNFRDMREQLPQLDRGFHALISDLYERGLEQDVAVVMWGEFGRAPRISRGDGRDHWPQAGAAVLAGGGFKVGQVIGETDSQGGEARDRPYTPSNVLATLYGHLGIDPIATIPDLTNRPMHVLDDRELVSELVAT
jgi:hypothetical protein